MMKMSTSVGIGALALNLIWCVTASAEIIGQWDFDGGDFTATVGSDLAFWNPGNLDAVNGTLFGFTTTLGIPDIGGTPAAVMKFPTAQGDNIAEFGYVWDPTIDDGNGGGLYINQYTMIMDIMFPASSIGTSVAFYSAFAQNFADAEFFKNTSGGIGVDGNYAGEMLADTWHRVVVVVDTSDFDTGVMKKYIDGVKVGEQNIEGQDLRWALDPIEVGMFMDNDGDVNEGYVNSIQWRDILLNDGQVVALGGATAAGIPAVLPQAPSFIEEWTPAISFALPTTDMEVVINAGDATISAITFSLDGVVQSPTITGVAPITTVSLANAAAGGPFLVGTTHTNVLSYFDDVLGATVTATNIFEIPLYLEDFEGLALGASPEEDPSRTDVWTQTGPAGWTIDNSLMAGFGDDATDGVSDWAGWAFANKGFWVEVAGDQGRAAFGSGFNTVLVVDGDEWDDSDHTDGELNTFVSSPAIPLAGATANSAFLLFDSSWWNWDDQTATIDASFDGGPAINVLRWSSSQDDPDFHGDYLVAGTFSRDEQVTVTLNNPEGATDVVITFGYTHAGNDWWWAFDNVVVKAGLVAPFINAHPQSVEVDEGDPVTFSVVAGGGALTYQWYLGTGAGRTAISGATGPDYSLAAATLADHLAIYSVDVVNSAGTETSAEAELRVIEVLVGSVLLEENFDGVPLGQPVDEATCGDVWSPDPPAGWILDNSGVPGFGDPATDGVREFAGWNFMDRDWYFVVSEDQGRSAFTLGTGVVAVADGDEWDDAAHDPGQMDTYLSTPPIPLAGAAAGTVNVSFDSSWWDYDTQTAVIAASFDGAAPVEIAHWSSDNTSPDYKANAANEAVTIPLTNPDGAANVVLTFAYLTADNDWWWAFDNVVVDDGTTTYFTEDFEGVILGQPVEEEPCAGGAAWTDTPPAGWAVDDSGVPSLPYDDLGMTEWEGWAFVEPVTWDQMVGLAREQFTKGSGAIAVADPEGWEDRGGVDTLALGPYNALLTTPAISLGGAAANTVAVRFDSSWLSEKSPDPLNQTAVLTASYDGGAPVEILRWEADPASPDFKATDYNETVTIHLSNPEGAGNVVLEFGLFDAGDDGWWAVDNLLVLAAVEDGPGVTGMSVSGGMATLTWDPAGSADQVQQTTDPVGDTWQDVGAPTDQGTATVPATDDVLMLRIAP